MQFRAGIVYVVLFVVIAAGAYAVAATADAPEVTIEEADADHQLEIGDEFTVEDRTYNVSELGGGSGTLEYVNDSAVFETDWEDEATVELEEDEEYVVYIHANDGDEEADEENGDEEADDEADDEAGPEAFTLVEAFDEDEYESVERDGELYIVVEEGDTEELVHITEFDDLESETYEVGDEVSFYETEMELQVDGEVIDLDAEAATIEYVGEEVTTYDLENRETLTIGDEEFGVYFPSEEMVYLTEDVESFEAQHDAVSEHHDRVHGLWWVVSLSVLTAILLAGMAFMPVRG